jgi:hypothetical protein
MGERPRCRTIAIPRQGATQRFNGAAMLQQEGGRDGRVPSVRVENSSMLGCGQENFGGLPTRMIKEANAGRVCEAAMLEIQHKVSAPVRQPSACRGAGH